MGADRLGPECVDQSMLPPGFKGGCYFDPVRAEVPNLFLVDGSSMVTSSRGQPTMTISALAFRAGEHIAGFAKRGEI